MIVFYARNKVISELKCISLLKTSLEKSSLKFRHVFNFLVFFTHENNEILKIFYSNSIHSV